MELGFQLYLDSALILYIFDTILCWLEQVIPQNALNIRNI